MARAFAPLARARPPPPASFTMAPAVATSVAPNGAPARSVRGRFRLNRLTLAKYRFCYLGLLPIFALIFRYPKELVWMSGGIVGLIMIRRLEGLEEDRRDGVPLPRAILGRLLFDLPRGKHGS